MPKVLRSYDSPELIQKRIELVEFYLHRALEWADKYHLRVNSGRDKITRESVKVSAWSSSYNKHK